MALPVIDSSVSLHIATRNVSNYIRNQEGMELIFRIEATRKHIQESPITPIRKHDLIYALGMYK